MLYLKNPFRFLKNIIVMPLVSSLIIPLIIMDIWVEIYHRICFPLCGIPYVQRKKYIKIIDRAKLKYLNPLQKIYCMYCGYGNGAFSYWKQIAGETEHYWCGIQHKKDPNFIPTEYQKEFAKYGDEEDFREKYYKK
jgi:hypothetical protein